MIDVDPKKLLQNAGFRATPGRIAFLQLLQKATEPLDIQDAIKKLRGHALDQATVYRIVEALRRKGIIQFVNLEHGHIHFELVSPTHHHHAICEHCGTIVDISKCNISHFEIEVKKVAGFENINRHSLEFFGTCKACSKKLAHKKTA